MVENWNVTTFVGALRTIRQSIRSVVKHLGQLQSRYIESGRVQYLRVRA